MTYQISGWASTPEADRVGHVVAAGAFDASIRQKGLTGPDGVRLLAFHDARLPLGRIRKLETKPKGLWMEADIDDRISYAKDLIAAVEAAGGLNFSVGFYPLDVDLIGDEQLVITRGELEEVSVVTFPANKGARMEEYKRKALREAEAAAARLKEIFA
ncbi:HK97 family phage prohead protease [Pukyongiella litopenaei]|uniref:HK97 family phage prohead protease n=1 Tax=Pukyongiella litopenaei TaxID=2605946 RepID=A0A2S0MNJ3_9RHOB|nr:HK97 family phage prohead protease [Pukyongiella litopenaei]AVO37311.1 HK97 family phage prohead protease [Pukyongiella litopenaei]